MQVWEGMLFSEHSFLHIMAYDLKNPFKCGERNKWLLYPTEAVKRLLFIHDFREHLTASANTVESGWL